MSVIVKSEEVNSVFLDPVTPDVLEACSRPNVIDLRVGCSKHLYFQYRLMCDLASYQASDEEYHVTLFKLYPVMMDLAVDLISRGRTRDKYLKALCPSKLAEFRAFYAKAPIITLCGSKVCWALDEDECHNLGLIEGHPLDQVSHALMDGACGLRFMASDLLVQALCTSMKQEDCVE